MSKQRKKLKLPKKDMGYHILKKLYFRRFEAKDLRYYIKNFEEAEWKHLHSILKRFGEEGYGHIYYREMKDKDKKFLGFAIAITTNGLNHIEKEIEYRKRYTHYIIMWILTSLIAISTIVNVWVSCQRES